jgi:hypothetical protein
MMLDIFSHVLPHIEEEAMAQRRASGIFRSIRIGIELNERDACAKNHCFWRLTHLQK